MALDELKRKVVQVVEKSREPAKIPKLVTEFQLEVENILSSLKDILIRNKNTAEILEVLEASDKSGCKLAHVAANLTGTNAMKNYFELLDLLLRNNADPEAVLKTLTSQLYTVKPGAAAYYNALDMLAKQGKNGRELLQAFEFLNRLAEVVPAAKMMELFRSNPGQPQLNLIASLYQNDEITSPLLFQRAYKLLETLNKRDVTTIEIKNLLNFRASSTKFVAILKAKPELLYTILKNGFAFEPASLADLKEVLVNYILTLKPEEKLAAALEINTEGTQLNAFIKVKRWFTAPSPEKGSWAKVMKIIQESNDAVTAEEIQTNSILEFERIKNATHDSFEDEFNRAIKQSLEEGKKDAQPNPVAAVVQQSIVPPAAVAAIVQQSVAQPAVAHESFDDDLKRALALSLEEANKVSPVLAAVLEQRPLTLPVVAPIVAPSVQQLVANDAYLPPEVVAARSNYYWVPVNSTVTPPYNPAVTANIVPTAATPIPAAAQPDAKPVVTEEKTPHQGVYPATYGAYVPEKTADTEVPNPNLINMWTYTVVQNQADQSLRARDPEVPPTYAQAISVREVKPAVSVQAQTLIDFNDPLPTVDKTPALLDQVKQLEDADKAREAARLKDIEEDSKLQADVAKFNQATSSFVMFQQPAKPAAKQQARLEHALK